MEIGIDSVKVHCEFNVIGSVPEAGVDPLADKLNAYGVTTPLGSEQLAEIA